MRPIERERLHCERSRLHQIDSLAHARDGCSTFAGVETGGGDADSHKHNITALSAPD